MSSKTTKRGGPGPGQQQQGRGRGGRGRRSPTRSSTRTPSEKFKGNEEKLAGHIFDCSDYRQADTFVNTHKRIADYVGAEYQEGGDIRSSIIHEARIQIPIPTNPTVVDPKAPTPDEIVARMIFKGELDTFVKRKSYLNQNIQMAYALVIGQCADLLQSKLKQQTQWAAISQDQDVIRLLNLIKTITFRFEDQKFLPLALYQAKSSLYSLRQASMNNHDYLQRFQTLVDVAMSYHGQLHDQAIIDIVTERLHPGTQYSALSTNQQETVQSASSDLYLATMFIHQSDRRRYGKLHDG
ncbi:hypothetical protein [uncultured Marinobacter sp.]|uniref:hypothetical protein n=1 Tax=uncultured Marinobacter sp. TaxID=187379 RepID=UPI00259248E8|nr:hypothetical protein [uncultured Marinobacter sp.]